MTLKEAFTIMDAIAFTICQEQGQAFTETGLDLSIFTEYVNTRSREIFQAFCVDLGIEEIEEEEEV